MFERLHPLLMAPLVIVLWGAGVLLLLFIASAVNLPHLKNMVPDSLWPLESWFVASLSRWSMLRSFCGVVVLPTNKHCFGRGDFEGELLGDFHVLYPTAGWRDRQTISTQTF